MNEKKQLCICRRRPLSRTVLTLAAAAGMALVTAAQAQVNIGTVQGQAVNKVSERQPTVTERFVGFGNVGLGGPQSALASTMDVAFDVSGIESIAELGNPANEVFNVDIGPDMYVIAAEWDVTIEAFSPSWLADMRLQFTDSAETTGVWFTPGVGDNLPGTGSYSGTVNLVDFGLDFQVGADGILRLEFWEDFVDFPAPEPDGVWISGTITFTITDEAPPPPDACIDGVGDCCSAQTGSPGCDDEDCCALICGQDAFCCNTNWDSLCAGAANSQCEVCQLDPDCGVTGTGDCCSANGTPYCDDEACCELICSQDAFCCNNQWDAACAAAANDQCDVCDVPGCGDEGSGDCCVAQPPGAGSPFCEDEECCELICGQDSFCCNVNWDSLCASAANNQCAVCQEDPDCGVTGTGDCCSANGTPYCDDEACCELICSQDAFCCNNQWDAACAAAANDQCEVCDVPGCGDEGSGDCCVAQPPGAGSPFCEDAECCELICGQDSFCCNVNWDSLCANAANNQCAICQPDPEGCSLGFWKNNTDLWVGYDPDDLFDEVFGSEVPPTSNCCSPQPPGCGCPGCDDADCEAAVCACDSFCCNTNWDSLCAGSSQGGTCGAAVLCADLCSPTADPLGVFGDCTLHDVISSPAGGPNACSGTPQANNLGRQAVAALLNAASSVEYPLSEQEVLEAVADAYNAWLDGAHHSVMTTLQSELDEFNNIGCPDFNTADLNWDGQVDGQDMLILLQSWGPVTEETRSADLNRDGSVDGVDLLLLLQSWGEQPPAWQR